MRFFGAALIISALTAAFAGRASAGGIMYSAPVVDGKLYCDIRNAGTSEVVGTIEIISYGGSTDAGPFSFTLAPGAGTYFSGLGASCKVTLTKGSPKKMRGVALYHYEADGAYTIPIQ